MRSEEWPEERKTSAKSGSKSRPSLDKSRARIRKRIRAYLTACKESGIEVSTEEIKALAAQFALTDARSLKMLGTPRRNGVRRTAPTRPKGRKNAMGYLPESSELGEE
jgi:hypothetical protein